jgi:hypothetical protein
LEDEDGDEMEDELVSSIKESEDEKPRKDVVA